MTRTAYTVRAIAALVAVLVFGAFFYTVHRLQKRIDALEPQAEKYEAICNGVRAQLAQDRHLLGNPHDREIMLDHFAGQTGDDSYVMLERCLPLQFPMAAWDSCVAKHDNACLGALLLRAEDSIP